MGVGGNTRFCYSRGGDAGPGPQSDPAVSLGGDNPVSTGLSDDVQHREAEIYNGTSWTTDMLDHYSGNIAQSLSGSVIHAAAGDWLMAIEQNTGDSPSYSSSDDARGSYAKILTMSAADNSAGNVDITLDRPLSGLAVSGDKCVVSKAHNVFPAVTAQQALDGLVDHSMLYWYKSDTQLDAELFFIEEVSTNGSTIEIMRPGTFSNAFSLSNVLAASTDSPFTGLGQVLLENIFFEDSGGPVRVPGEPSAEWNGTFATSNFNSHWSPFWLRRTVPPNSQPGDCVFALRCVSNEDTGGTPFADFDKLQTGAVISYNIAPPTSRVMTTTIDRIIYSPGGARIVTTLKDGNDNPLPDRSLVITVVHGSVVQDPQEFTNADGQITNTYTCPAGSGGVTETFTSTLSRDPAE